MKKMRFLIVSIVFIALTNCVSLNFRNTHSNIPKISSTAQFFNCYIHKVHTVMFIGKFDVPRAITPISMIRMDIPIDENTNTIDILVSKKPQLFLISIQTHAELEITLKYLKKSSWWNIRGLYIIHLTATNSCDKAYEFLQTMWLMDLLNSMFICDSNEATLYTYNPYANYATKLWKFVEQPLPNDPWTLFEHRITSNKNSCAMLFFDKTKVFNGYAGIKAAAAYNDQILLNNSTEHDLKMLNDDDQQVADMLYETLNLTLNYTSEENRGFIDINGNAYGMLQQLVSGEYDIVLNSRYPAYAKGMKVSSVIAQSGLSIVSQPRGFLSIVKKIYDYFKPWLFVVLIALSIVNAIMLKFSYKNRSFGVTLLDVIGLVFDGSFLKNPTTTSSRIFLIGTFLFIIIIQSLFRGRILVFLTKPIPKRNMDTFEDLKADNSYTIHCDLGMRKFVDVDLRERCLNTSMELSIIEVLNDSKSTCISDRLILIRFMTKHNAHWLHLSRDIVVKQYGIYMMRENWPLGDRISQGVSRLFESHLSALVYRRVYGKAISKIKATEENQLLLKISSIKLADLIFAFQVLGFGLACATMCFVVEIPWWTILRKIF